MPEYIGRTKAFGAIANWGPPSCALWPIRDAVPVDETAGGKAGFPRSLGRRVLRRGLVSTLRLPLRPKLGRNVAAPPPRKGFLPGANELFTLLGAEKVVLVQKYPLVIEAGILVPRLDHPPRDWPPTGTTFPQQLVAVARPCVPEMSALMFS
jgi:hypothetical protein